MVFCVDKESSKLYTQMLTVKDLDHNDKLIELFSCGDERNFIPVNSFTLSSIGIHLLPNFISVSYNTLFVTNSRYTFVIDINKFSVIYTLPLHQYCGNLQSVDVKYTGNEIFIHRKLFSEISEPDDESSNSNDEEDEHYLESFVDIFIAPKPSISLYGICREFILKTFSDKEIQNSSLPGKFKKEISSLKSVY